VGHGNDGICNVGDFIRVGAPGQSGTPVACATAVGGTSVPQLTSAVCRPPIRSPRAAVRSVTPDYNGAS